MKKCTTIILIFSLLCTIFLFSGCSEEPMDYSAKVQEKTTAYRTDLEDSAKTLNSTDKIKEYLCNWAKSKGISYTTDEFDNVIMDIDSSKSYKAAAPTVILCPYDAKQFNNYIDPMSVALYLAKNNEHTGELTVIFTSEKGHDFSGIKGLSKKYFPDDANVFSLSGGKKNMWSLNTGGRSSYTFTNKVAFTTPVRNKAYKISIKGLPGGIPDSKISSYPNPIKELGDLLAYFKTNALIYELAKISGGSSGNLYPKSSSMTVVIDENDSLKFENKLNDTIERFNDDFLEDYPDATFTFTETPLPEKVLSEEYTNEFISLLYTLLDGVYYTDEEDNLISITSIGSIKNTKNSYSISAVGNSLTELNMKLIDTDYETICGLSDVDYQKTDWQKVWNSNCDSDFAKELIAAFDEYSGSDLDFKDSVPATNASYIFRKNEQCNIVNITLNEEKIERYTGAILIFMINQAHEETK
ncbi:dipeptidase D [Clostridiales Family XIII bacterium PM5-7]